MRVYTCGCVSMYISVYVCVCVCVCVCVHVTGKCTNALHYELVYLLGHIMYSHAILINECR